MPTYAYECGACGHRLEEFQSMTAKPLVLCPACKKRKLQRLIGAGAGIIFKGSGFYITDYRNKGGAGASESTKSDSKSSDTTSGDSKSSDAPAPAKSGDGAANPKQSSREPQ